MLLFPLLRKSTLNRRNSGESVCFGTQFKGKVCHGKEAEATEAQSCGHSVSNEEAESSKCRLLLSSFSTYYCSGSQPGNSATVVAGSS